MGDRPLNGYPSTDDLAEIYRFNAFPGAQQPVEPLPDRLTTGAAATTTTRTDRHGQCRGHGRKTRRAPCFPLSLTPNPSAIGYRNSGSEARTDNSAPADSRQRGFAEAPNCVLRIVKDVGSSNLTRSPSSAASHLDQPPRTDRNDWLRLLR